MPKDSRRWALSMPESHAHVILVRAIVQWVDNQPTADSFAVFTANAALSADHQPPIIGGRIPDVFARHRQQGHVIIGEAKTAQDIETSHTRKQLSDYLTYLAIQHQPTLILAVPWYCTNQVRSLVRRIQRETNTDSINVVVLEKLPG